MTLAQAAPHSQRRAGSTSRDRAPVTLTASNAAPVAAALGCTASGACAGDVPDGDLDLLLWKSNGTLPCASTSFDGTWEVCDIAVNAGDTFQAQLYLASNAASFTYLGISWYNYTTSSE